MTGRSVLTTPPDARRAPSLPSEWIHLQLGLAALIEFLQPLVPDTIPHQDNEEKCHVKARRHSLR